MFRALEAPSRQDQAVRIGNLIIDLSSQTVLPGGTASGATDSARRAQEERLTEKGPIGLANQPIRQCLDDFATERRARQRLTSLLARTDAMLAELEGLNLLGLRQVTGSSRSELAALVRDVAFGDAPQIGWRPSLTASIDLIFEIQGRLFDEMYGNKMG